MTRVSAVPDLVAKSEPVTHARGWQAELRLGFRGRGGITRLVERRHVGPLVVQRPFYPESNGCCHVYLVHPPGGVVGGDELTLSASLTESARTLITTPAATKLYRTGGAEARVNQRFAVASGSSLEWLPQETIAFSGCRALLATRIELQAGANFIGWEVTCLGRPAAGEAFGRGSVDQSFEVWRAGTPLLRERQRLSGNGPELSAAWGLGGHTTLATLIATSGGHDWESARLGRLLTRLRTEVACEHGLLAFTQVSGLLICRYLGDGAEPALAALRRTWELARPEVLQSPATRPRIWAT